MSERDPYDLERVENGEGWVVQYAPSAQRFEIHSVGTVQAAVDLPETEKSVKAQGLSVVIDNDCGELIKVTSSPIMVPVVMLFWHPLS